MAIVSYYVQAVKRKIKKTVSVEYQKRSFPINSLHYILFCTENTVTCITQARENVTVFI